MDTSSWSAEQYKLTPHRKGIKMKWKTRWWRTAIILQCTRKMTTKWGNKKFEHLVDHVNIQ
jgi:hypothetical protein